MPRTGIFASARVAPGAWTPASLSGLAVWLDADDAATFSYSSGSVVSQWNDKSGNGRHFSQGTVSAQPSRTGTLGSLPGVVFDASNDFLGFTGTTITAQPLTVAIVAKATSNPGNANLIDTSTSSGRVLIEARSGSLWRMFAGTVRDVTGSNVIGTLHAVVAKFNGASSELRVDGVSLGTGNAGSNSLLSGSSSTLYLGRGQAAYLGATIGEVIIVSGALSGTDLTNLETYLTSKWGI